MINMLTISALFDICTFLITNIAEVYTRLPNSVQSYSSVREQNGRINVLFKMWASVFQVHIAWSWYNIGNFVLIAKISIEWHWWSLTEAFDLFDKFKMKLDWIEELCSKKKGHLRSTFIQIIWKQNLSNYICDKKAL